MRAPYLYDDVDVLKNIANIKNRDLLSKSKKELDVVMKAVKKLKRTDGNEKSIV